MRATPRAKDDPNTLRRQLLIELSVLRRRYAKLAGDGDGSEKDAEVTSSAAASSSCEQSVSAEDDGGALGQSDRDAIEALFHSVDDFTRDFNEGKGELQRGDIVSAIVRGST